MKEIRLVQLIHALSSSDIDFVKTQIKAQQNKMYLPLFTAIHLLIQTPFNREEIYLRVYKKKWTPKGDAIFRTDQSRLADFIEDILIQKRWKAQIKNDEEWQQEERINLYLDLKLFKEAEYVYNEISTAVSYSFSGKNRINDKYADYLMKSHLPLKEKERLMGVITKNYLQNSQQEAEIRQAKSWYLKCMHNYYHKQLTNTFFEEIVVEEVLKIADEFVNEEAKLIILNGIAYLKIDSPATDISLHIYEETVRLATILVNYHPRFLHYKAKALHLIGTRYSILGDFKNGNKYFEQAIIIIPKEQYLNYKTIFLNYATNCSKQKQFAKAIELIHLLEEEAARDSKLKTECAIRSLSCYLFMENAPAIHALVNSQDYNLIQPHEKIYFRLCQCNAFLMENEFEFAHSEITNLLRSKLMQEIDVNFIPATELMNFMIAAVFKNGKIKLTPAQVQRYEKVKAALNIQQFPYLRHYSPFLWLEQKLLPQH
ncbi:MAG: hypothetical protein U0T31_07045 [Chitinophagales bacterium]